MGTGNLDAQKEHLVVVVMIGAALACSVFSQSGADTTMQHAIGLKHVFGNQHTRDILVGRTLDKLNTQKIKQKVP